jgi:hypothetical protein
VYQRIEDMKEHRRLGMECMDDKAKHGIPRDASFSQAIDMNGIID